MPNRALSGAQENLVHFLLGKGKRSIGSPNHDANIRDSTLSSRSKHIYASRIASTAELLSLFQ